MSLRNYKDRRYNDNGDDPPQQPQNRFANMQKYAKRIDKQSLENDQRFPPTAEERKFQQQLNSWNENSQEEQKSQSSYISKSQVSQQTSQIDYGNYQSQSFNYSHRGFHQYQSQQSIFNEQRSFQQSQLDQSYQSSRGRGRERDIGIGRGRGRDREREDERWDYRNEQNYIGRNENIRNHQESNYSNQNREDRNAQSDRRGNQGRRENKIKQKNFYFSKQPFFRFIQRKIFQDALNSHNSTEIICEYLNQNFTVPNSLQQAIDNTQYEKYRQLGQDFQQIIKLLLASGGKNAFFVGEIYGSQKIVNYMLQTLKNQFYDEELKQLKQICVHEPKNKTRAIYFIKQNIENFQEFIVLSPNNLCNLPISKFKEFLQFLNNRVYENDKEVKDVLQQIQKIQGQVEELEIKQIRENQKKEESQKQKQNKLRRKFILDPQVEGDYEINYQDCPCEPHQIDFVNSEQSLGKIVKLKINEPYDSPEQYFNNNFYILREDYMRSFRQAICQIRESSVQNLNPQIMNDVYIYNEVTLKSATINQQGIQFTLRMKPVSLYKRQKKKIKWASTSRLMTGSLLLITTSKIPADSMIFLTINRKEDRIPNYHNFQDYYNQTGNVMIIATLINTDDDTLDKINKIMSEKDVIIIEHKIFFETYVHYLKSLKLADVTALPFTNTLVYANKKVPIPLYFNENDVIKGVNYAINLEFNLNKKNIAQITHQVDIFGMEWPKYLRATLDDSQYEAIRLMLRTGISLVQGPPGTGKTYCGALAVRILLQNQDRWNKNLNQGQMSQIRQNIVSQNCPILIVCYTNHALDQFLNHILTFEEENNIVRLGGRCKDEKLMPCMLPKIEDKFKFEWYKFRELQAQVEKEFQTLLQLQEVSFKDFLKYWPQFLNNIVIDFCRMKDYRFRKYQFSTNTQKLLFGDWQQAEVPDQNIIKNIIEEEKQLLNPCEQGNNPKIIRKMLRPKQIPPEIMVNQEALQKMQEEILSENDENLDSDEEEDRKFLSQNYEDRNDNKLNIKYFNRVGYDEQKFEEVKRKLENGANLWELQYVERLRICDQIFYLRYKDKIDNFRKTFEEYNDLLQRLKLERLQQQIAYIKEKKIVGVTVTGCAKYAEKLAGLGCKIMIIEEAAEVLESHVVSILSPSIQHLILIGDHQQLRPKVENYELESKYKTNISLFERLVLQEIPFKTLKKQRRMKSKFADFIRLIYENGYMDHEQEVKEKNKEFIQGVRDDLILFDHREKEQQIQEQSSKQNLYEAEMIVNMINYLIMNRYKPSQITALTLYAKQAITIKKMIEPLQYQHKYGSKVFITTVDNYQGEENDIIFLSLVRSNKDQQIGFVKNDNRVCVAFSRARIGLYVFGNFDCIEKSLIQSKNQHGSTEGLIWLKILDLARKKQVLMKEISLQCFSHNRVSKIQKVQDWNLVRSGGCKEICNLRFDCGHVCKQQCHYMEHVRMNCREKCEITFSCGHQCTKFCKDYPCPPCYVLVKKQLNCGHTQMVPCSLTINQVKCQSQCERILPCDHVCQAKCSDECTKYCMYEKNIKIKACDHYISAKCYESDKVQYLKCSKPCESVLSCGHECTGTCDQCFNFTLHRPCTKPCQQILICQHQCARRCSQPCLKCPKKCEYKCCDAVCQKICGDVCAPCYAKCQFKCEHSNCKKKCIQFCDRNPCEKRCTNELDCGCQCLGLCGEKCPPLCKIEDHNTSKDPFEILFGNEDEEGSLFYQVECPGKHIFEVKGLDTYLQNESEKINRDGGIMKFLKCPKCNQIISKSSRYNQYIKQVFQNINNVKIKQNQMTEGTPQKKKQILDLVDKNLTQTKNKQDIEYLNNLKKILEKPKEEISKYHENYFENQIGSFKAMVELRNQRKSYKGNLNLEEQIFYKQSEALEELYLSNTDFIFEATDEIWGNISRKVNSLLFYNQLIQLNTHMQQQQQGRQQRHPKIDQLGLFLNQLKKQYFMLSEDQILQTQRFISQNSGLSREEQLIIAKALPDIKPGHWFKCPNGHYFAIVDCGGAMVVSKCADCGVPIGGQNHTLISNNKHTGDFDGTKYAAWSQEANNMRNFNMDQFNDDD